MLNLTLFVFKSVIKAFSFFLLLVSFFSELKIVLISWLPISGIICLWDFEILIFGNEIVFWVRLFISDSLFWPSLWFEIEGYSGNLLIETIDLFVLFVDDVKLEKLFLIFFKDIFFL